MMNLPWLFGAVLVAATAALIGNRLLYGLLRRGRAVIAIAWWEEASKAAVIAVLPNLSLLAVHIVFGVLELVYDLWRSRSDGLYLGLLSLCVHGLIGGLAALAYRHFGSLWTTYLVAGSLHSLLNLAVLQLVLPALGARQYASGR